MPVYPIQPELANTSNKALVPPCSGHIFSTVSKVPNRPGIVRQTTSKAPIAIVSSITWSSSQARTITTSWTQLSPYLIDKLCRPGCSKVREVPLFSQAAIGPL